MIAQSKELSLDLPLECRAPNPWASSCFSRCANRQWIIEGLGLEQTPVCDAGTAGGDDPLFHSAGPYSVVLRISNRFD